MDRMVLNPGMLHAWSEVTVSLDFTQEKWLYDYIRMSAGLPETQPNK